MPKSTSQIRVGSNGTVFVAPVGTAAPVDIATAWGAAWIDLGYTSEDGVSITDSRSNEAIPVWQLFYAARYVVTERDFRLSFTLRQWSKDTVKLALGGGTIATTVGPPAHYLYTPPSPDVVDERAFGLEWIDGTVTNRLVIPRGIVIEDVETNITRTGAADLPITVGVMGADATAPYTLRSNDPAFA